MQMMKWRIWDTLMCGCETIVSVDIKEFFYVWQKYPTDYLEVFDPILEQRDGKDDLLRSLWDVFSNRHITLKL